MTMADGYGPNNPPRFRKPGESVEDYRVAMGWDTPPKPAKIGPTVTIRKSCSACACERSESYAAQGDSGCHVYCQHEAVGKRKIGNDTWVTPDWCPAEDTEDLKPCPFCGSPAEIITLEGETDEPSIGAQCVQCTSSACGAASGLVYPLMDDVTALLRERWNKRHNVRAKPATAAAAQNVEDEQLPSAAVGARP